MRLILFGAIVTTLATMSCSEAPTEPRPIPDANLVYFYDSGDLPSYIQYDPQTSVLDTFRLPFKGQKGRLAPDGHSIWTIRSNATIVQMDLESRQIIKEIVDYPALRGFELSPDGKLIAIMSLTLVILRVSDLSVYYQDSIPAAFGRFSADATAFFCSVIHEGAYHAQRIGLEEGFPITRRSFTANVNPMAVTRIVPSIDQSLWFVYLHLSDEHFYFAAYDPVSDSVVFNRLLSPEAGNIAVTPDGKYAIYSIPGLTIGYGDEPFPGLKIYDIESNEEADEISTQFTDSTGVFNFIPDEFLISPDGRWLTAIMRTTTGDLILIDLNRMEIVERKQLGFMHSFSSLMTKPFVF